MKCFSRVPISKAVILFLLLFMSTSIFAQDNERFYKKSAYQDDEIKKLELIYSPTSVDNEERTDVSISDMEIVTSGGVGTKLTIETYGAGFKVLGSYSTVINTKTEYNYIKTDIFGEDCICYRIVTDGDCELKCINFYGQVAKNNLELRQNKEFQGIVPFNMSCISFDIDNISDKNIVCNMVIEIQDYNAFSGIVINKDASLLLTDTNKAIGNLSGKITSISDSSVVIDFGNCTINGNEKYTIKACLYKFFNIGSGVPFNLYTEYRNNSSNPIPVAKIIVTDINNNSDICILEIPIPYLGMPYIN